MQLSYMEGSSCQGGDQIFTFEDPFLVELSELVRLELLLGLFH